MYVQDSETLEKRYGRRADGKIAQRQTSPKMRRSTPNACTMAAAASVMPSSTEDHVEIWSTVTRGITWAVYLSTRFCAEALQCEPRHNDTSPGPLNSPQTHAMAVVVFLAAVLCHSHSCAPTIAWEHPSVNADRSAARGGPLTQRVRLW